MSVSRIAVIGGDGIGPEVIDQAIRVADAALRHESGARLDWNRLPWSGDHYLKVGWMMPPDGWDVLREEDPQALTNTATKETAVAAAEAILADEGGEGEIVVHENEVHHTDDTSRGVKTYVVALLGLLVAIIVIIVITSLLAVATNV